MLDRPPRESEWRSWLFVGLWTLVIYCTIPFARRIQEFVSDRWGREMFTVVVLVAVLAVGAAALARCLRDGRPGRGRRLIWLGAVAAVTIHLAGRFTSPEEALHFLEYGLLGVLAFRALAHRLDDAGIYLAAALVCAILGTFDEVIQWMTPRRFFDFRDIRLNALAGALALAAVWQGVVPPFVRRGFGPRSVRAACRLGVAQLLLLGLCASNTPQAVAWYAARVPLLQPLNETTSEMAEYGYRHEDPEIGAFFSRFPVEGLRKLDAARAGEVAGFLDEFKDDRKKGYERFLKKYSPGTDPFAHEFRVHLFRRDHYFAVAWRYQRNPRLYRLHRTVACRENQILETYFGQTLARTGADYSPGRVAELEKELDRASFYESPVSAGLITRFSEGQVWAGILAGIALLTWIDRRCSRGPAGRAESEP